MNRGTSSCVLPLGGSDLCKDGNGPRKLLEKETGELCASDYLTSYSDELPDAQSSPTMSHVSAAALWSPTIWSTIS